MVSRDHKDEERVVAHYLQMAAEGERIGWGRSPLTDTQATIKRIKGDAKNIEAIIDYMLDHPDHRSVRSALALCRFYRFAGMAGHPRILEKAIRASGNSEDGDWRTLHAECFRLLGSMARLRLKRWKEKAENVFGEAQEYYDRALNNYMALSDNVAKTLGIGHCNRAIGDMKKTPATDPETRKQAREYYEKASRQYDDVLKVLGQQVNGVCENEIKTEQRWQAQRGTAWCLANLGDLAHMSPEKGEDRLFEARAFYEEAATIFHDEGGHDDIGYAHCLKGLGDISHLAREGETNATDCYEKAKACYCTSGYQVGVADCEYSLGDEALRSGDEAEAGNHYNEALRRYSELGALHGVANCYYSLGDVMLFASLKNSADKGEAEAKKIRAGKDYDDALKRYEEIGSTIGPANCHQGRGDILAGGQGEEEYERAHEMRLLAFGGADIKPSFEFLNCKRWRR